MSGALDHRTRRCRWQDRAATLVTLATIVVLAACGANPVSDDGEFVSAAQRAVASSPQGSTASARPAAAESGGAAPSGVAIESDGAADSGGAAEFVDALAQLPDCSPSSVTFVFERRALAGDPFLRELEREVQNRGFGVRRFTTLGDENEVGHVAQIGAGGQLTRTVQFGSVMMQRRFKTADGGRWTPAGPLLVEDRR